MAFRIRGIRYYHEPAHISQQLAVRKGVWFPRKQSDGWRSLLPRFRSIALVTGVIWILSAPFLQAQTTTPTPTPSTTPTPTPNPTPIPSATPAYPLKASANGRYLVDQNDVP